MAESSEKIRIDKWLWHARFFKTRSLSAKIVSAGGCRINGQPVAKPAALVASGDILTFPQNTDIRVIRMLAPGTRRGPAPEAQMLYEDLDPPAAKPKPDPGPHTPRYEEGGRPSKRDRRALDQLRRDMLE